MRHGGRMRMGPTEWRARQDSNLQPSDEAPATSRKRASSHGPSVNATRTVDEWETLQRPFLPLAPPCTKGYRPSSPETLLEDERFVSSSLLPRS